MLEGRSVRLLHGRGQEPFHLGECFLARLRGGLRTLPLEPAARKEAGKDEWECEGRTAHGVSRLRWTSHHESRLSTRKDGRLQGLCSGQHSLGFRDWCSALEHDQTPSRGFL